MYKVSVIIPVYNSEAYILKTLKSITDQTYKNLEIIIINDGSTDESMEICTRVSKKDERVKIFNKSNGGVSSARNLGISKSNGEFIIFVDADDYLDQNHIKELLLDITSKNSSVTFTGHKEIYSNKTILKTSRLESRLYKLNDVMDKLVDDGTVSGILFGSACTSIYRSEIIKKNNIYFPENIKINEDGIFNIKYILNTDSISVNNQIKTYNYLQNTKESRDYFYLKKSLLEANNEIISIFKNTNQNIEKQLKYREISISLWLLLNVCNQETWSRIRILDEMDSILEKLETSVFKNLNYSQMGNHKKVYVTLIRFKLKNIIYLLTRYLIPLARK